MPTTIQLPAGTEWVTIRSIPELFARALHGAPRESAEFTAHDMAWHGTVIEYEEVMKHAVMHGEVVPRNAMTHRPMPYAIGQAMLNSIMSVDDLMEFAARFYVGVSVEAAQTETGPAPAKGATGDTALIIGRFEPPEGEALNKAQELKARKGRLTVMEAIQTLKAKAEFINLSTAVKAGEIPSYAPGSNKRLVGNTDNCGNDEELLPAELNAWLKEKHPHVDFRFPKVGDGDTAKSKADKPTRKKPARRDGLKVAMEAGYRAMMEANRTAPTARALFDWLTENGEQYGIVDSTDDKLTWTKADKTFEDTDFKAFQNRFTRLSGRNNPQ